MLSYFVKMYIFEELSFKILLVYLQSFVVLINKLLIHWLFILLRNVEVTD